MSGNVTGADSAGRIETLLFGVPIPDEYLENLRAKFPGITFIRAQRDEIDPHLPVADAVIAWHLTPEQLAIAPRLKWIQSFAAGVDRMPFAELAARDIVVTNSSGVHAANIAEHILAMMLAFARQLPWLLRHPPAGDWFEMPVRSRIFELGQQELLVVGTGDIGLSLAERARGLGMVVNGVRRRVDLPAPQAFSKIYPVTDLAEALPSADHVAICLPLTSGTRGLFDAAMLARMKHSAYIYNVGRGQIIDQDALIKALDEGTVAGAGLDVTDPEPLPADSPLWSMENVMVTAHTSGSTPRYWERIMAILETNIARFEAGEPLHNVVDGAAGY
jgi:phosphoglycerate dehydrogenase-like enzyme